MNVGRGGRDASADVRVAGFKIAWKDFDDGCSVDLNIRSSLNIRSAKRHIKRELWRTYSKSTPRNPERVITGALCRERPLHSAMWSLMNSDVMSSPGGCDSRGSKRVA